MENPFGRPCHAPCYPLPLPSLPPFGCLYSIKKFAYVLCKSRAAYQFGICKFQQLHLDLWHCHCTLQQVQGQDTHTHRHTHRTRFSNIFIIWYLSFEFCVNVLVTNIWLDSLSLFPAEYRMLRTEDDSPRLAYNL